MAFFQSMFRGGARYMGRGANKVYGDAAVEAMGWGRAIGGDALMNMGRASKWLSRTGLRSNMAAGAIGGGMYGAVSDDTSVLGGAIMGAGLGAGAYGAGRGITSYRGLRVIGRSRSRAAYGALNLMGIDSKRFIGNTSHKAMNSFRAMWR